MRIDKDDDFIFQHCTEIRQKTKCCLSQNISYKPNLPVCWQRLLPCKWLSYKMHEKYASAVSSAECVCVVCVYYA